MTLERTFKVDQSKDDPNQILAISKKPPPNFIRLNEKSANRQNANRLFDSQNNNRGGYNVGDLTDKAANNNPNLQYQVCRLCSNSIAVWNLA